MSLFLGVNIPIMKLSFNIKPLPAIACQYFIKGDRLNHRWVFLDNSSKRISQQAGILRLAQN